MSTATYCGQVEYNKILFTLGIDHLKYARHLKNFLYGLSPLIFVTTRWDYYYYAILHQKQTFIINIIPVF